MNEPVAYLVSQEPLSAVRWLSDVKPIGIDDKQITPLYTSEQLQNKIEMTTTEFELLAKVCRGIRPFQKIEQHINIVPEMKWFVQMKNENGKTRFLHKNLFDKNHVLNYGSLKYYAKYFDTKEEAELWTTPLTEAVQLPVEEQL